MSEDWDTDLERFDDDYANAKVDKNKGKDVPDGRYQVNVERVYLRKSKTSGKPMLSWELKILAPQHTGRRLFRNNMLATKENIGWLKQDLTTCGLELEKLSDLPQHIDRLLDIRLEVQKSTKGDYDNVYFNKRLDVDVPNPLPSEPLKPDGLPPEDDLPF